MRFDRREPQKRDLRVTGLLLSMLVELPVVWTACLAVSVAARTSEQRTLRAARRMASGQGRKGAGNSHTQLGLKGREGCTPLRSGWGLWSAPPPLPALGRLLAFSSVPAPVPSGDYFTTTTGVVLVRTQDTRVLWGRYIPALRDRESLTFVPGLSLVSEQQSLLSSTSLSGYYFSTPITLLWTCFVTVFQMEALASKRSYLIIDYSLTSLILSAILLVTQLRIPLVQ